MLRKARKNTMGLFNFDNTLDWVGKNESDGEIFYGYNNGEGRNMKLVERQIDLIKKIIDDLSKVIERDESISDVNELKNIVSFWKEVRNDFELKFIKGQAFTAKDKIKEFDELVAVFEKTIFKIDEVEKIIINRFEKIREILKNKHKLEIGCFEYRSYKLLCCGWVRDCSPGCEMFTALNDLHKLYTDVSGEYLSLINDESDLLEDDIIKLINESVNEKIYMDIIEIMDMRIEELPIKEFDCLDYISDDVLDIEFVPIEDMHIDVIENEYSYDVRWDIDDLNNYWNGMLQGLQDIVDNAENNIKNNFVNGISKMVLEYLRTQRIMFKKFIDKI
jgi:hypothetical protein